jgi:hypothetical protein
MARIFTISFIYNEERYNTIVTVRTSPLFIEYILAHLDADLLELLPGNRIISPSPNDFFFPNASSQHSLALMKCIIKAVAVHMQEVKS